MPFSSDPALQMETTERIRPVKIFFEEGGPVCAGPWKICPLWSSRLSR